MNQVTTIAKIFFVALCLTSCATSEYLSVKSGCNAEAQRQYPPKLQNYVVTKTKQVEVGDGNFRCISTERPIGYTVGNSQMETITNCQEGKKYVDREYRVTETEDLNEDARRNFVNQCAANRCVQLYGNNLCETSKTSQASPNVKATSITDAQAQNDLGLKYAKGEGVTQDYAAAAKWFQLAAAQGFADGQDNLGVIYQYGFGVPKDYVAAVKWFRLAASQGQANAQNNLGIMFEHGQGVPSNRVTAYALYSVAASNDNSYGKRGSKYQATLASTMSAKEIEIGQALLVEMRVPGNFLKALDNFQKSH